MSSAHVERRLLQLLPDHLGMVFNVAMPPMHPATERSHAAGHDPSAPLTLRLYIYMSV